MTPAPRLDGIVPPEAAELPERGAALADALHELAAILPGLKTALEHAARPPVARLAYRIDELAAALGVSRRIIERERAAGRVPGPDLYIGKCPLWRFETVRDWLHTQRGGGR